MNTKFCLIETEGMIKVEIEGSGKELVNILASAMKKSDNIKEIITISLLALIMKEEEVVDEEESDDDLVKMLSKMKIGLA
jgi:uncharacterized protein YqeY